MPPTGPRLSVAAPARSAQGRRRRTTRPQDAGPQSGTAAVPGRSPHGLLPPDGAEYPLILRGAGYAWWRAALGVVLALLTYPLLTPVINQALVALAWATAGASEDHADYARRAYAFELPSGMLAANLAIAAFVPVCWLLVPVVHRRRPRWLSSVQPRIRWRYLLVGLAVALVLFVGVPLLTSPSGPVPAGAVRPGFWTFLAVIILTSPLQAVAEELFFRGYLLQALSSLLARPWLGVVVSAVVFAVFHGAQSPAMFVDHLALGLLAGIVVWRTGGLEAVIAAHVVNNVYSYVVAGLTTSPADIRATIDITWQEAATDVGRFLVFVIGAVLVARWMRLRTRVDLARGR